MPGLTWRDALSKGKPGKPDAFECLKVLRMS